MILKKKKIVKKGKPKRRVLKSKIEKPWEITAHRYVCYIDIMGFKDLVARNSHETIYEMMKKVSNVMRSTQSVFAVDYESDGFEINIIMMNYSDSLMIYSRDDEMHSLENFISSISVITEDLFKNQVPHRGAIAFGKMTLDFENSIFFGQPLIDAYLLQEELNFYGVVVHATSDDIGLIENEEIENSIIEYNCQFKQGNANHFTILPGIIFDESFDEEKYQVLLNSVLNLRDKTSGALRKYIDNTVKYLEYSRIECLKKNKELRDLENNHESN